MYEKISKLFKVDRCMDKATQIAQSLNPATIANIGDCYQPRWPGAEVVDARRSIDVDFNTHPLPFTSDRFDLVVCEQVIEHLHNTTFFLSELHRICKVGGHLLLATENMTSIPNVVAMVFGMAPFSTQPCCGFYCGGIKRGVTNPGVLSRNHPAFSGVSGHVRVMSVRQLKTLVTLSGFLIVNKWTYCLRHFVLLHAIKV